MSQDAIIRQHVTDLQRTHGAAALEVAKQQMQEQMQQGDVAAAGIWLSVMYELTRTEAKA